MSTGDVLEVAVHAARAAGKVALEKLTEPGYVRWKGHRDPVSGSIMAVQEALLEVLAAETPDHGILAEEGPEDQPIPVDAENLWIVDPICGSINYVRGIPYFGISIAHRSGGDIQAGVVYDPCRDELFAATSDGSATLNGATITVEQVAEGYEAFERSWLGMDWPVSEARRTDAQYIAGIMGSQVVSLTAMGSPALGICNVAVGRLHAYWHLELKIWDIAAAALILTRAGGTLTDSAGASWLYGDGGYIASNSIIHGWTLRCLQQAHGHEKMLGAKEGAPAMPEPPLNAAR